MILDRVMFANAIMTDIKIRKGDQHLHYKLEQWKKADTFDILNNISEYVTLVQLMYSLCNVNNALSVVRNWILIQITKILAVDIDSLDLIFACSDEDDYFARFQVVFYAVRYVNKGVISKRVQK